MRILHAHWHPSAPPGGGDGRAAEGAENGTQNGLLFWAETTHTEPPGKRDRRVKAPQAHPFSAPPDAVAEIVQAVAGPEEAAVAGEHRSVALWLPTLRHGPQPSPSLLHDWDLAEEKGRTLLPSVVEGVWLPPVASFDVLAALPAQNAAADEALPPDLHLSDDVRYWQRAGALVLETLAQQKVRPALLEVAPGTTYHARWRPVLDGPDDAPRLAALADAMPAVCRAEAIAPAPEGKASAGVHDPGAAASPRLLLEAFLDTMTDALMRRWGRPADLNVPAESNEPVHRWLQALRAPTPEVNGPRAPLQHLYGSYRAWLRNLHASGDATFRVAFRMEAPEQQRAPTRDDSPDAEAGSDPNDERAWTLHFLLQARDDPSLLVPAAQVWQVRDGTLAALGRTFDQPQEKLLAGLGYVAGLFEPLRRGLRAAAPEAVRLTAEEAYTFLRDVAPLLEQSRFGVLVPPWWNKPGTRLGVRLQLGSRLKTSKGTTGESTGHLSLDRLVEYQWQLALGDTTLTREEFDALVDLKTPLVQIRGQWVQLDPDQIEAAIRFWEAQDLEGEKPLQEMLRAGLLGEADEAHGLPVDDVAFEGALRDWMDRLHDRDAMEALPPPDGLEATLRPYQRDGVAWLDFMRRSGMGTILADDMGLGKTLQALTMILHVKERGQLSRPVLVVCPTSVVSNWEREARRFTPALRTVMHHGPDRQRGEAFAEQAAAADVIYTSYALARRDGPFLAKVQWRGIILDEAQNIKNPDTKQAQTLRGLPAGFRVALTGTPVENRLMELWSIMQFLNPGFLGPRKRFRKTFAHPIQRYNDEEAAGRLRRLTQPFILRRLKTDANVIQDLPDKQETKVHCTLSEEQATLYESIVQDTLREVDEAEGMARKGRVLSMMMKLKQVCNHPVQFLHQAGAYAPAEDDGRSGKLERLAEILEVVASEGDRALLFTQFTEMGALLKRFVQERLGLATLFRHGGTPGPKRDDLVRRFQDDPDGPTLFILSLKAGGTGLNLTRATHVFHYDQWWNPAVEDQATDRAYRIGQHRNVQVHKFVCTGTLEERIDEMIASKKALAERIIGGGDEWVTELSTDDLHDLVALRNDAMKERG